MKSAITLWWDCTSFYDISNTGVEHPFSVLGVVGSSRMALIGADHSDRNYTKFFISTLGLTQTTVSPIGNFAIGNIR